MSSYFNPQNTFDFREIALKAFQKIFEMSCNELKQQKRILMSSNINMPMEIVEEDLRVSYSQAVEALGIIVAPWFDSDQTEIFDNFLEIMNLDIAEYSEKFKEKIKKHLSLHEIDLDSLPPKSAIEKIIEYRKDHKVVSAKEVFYQISFMMKKKDYFKRQTTTDNSAGNNQVVEVDEEEEDV